MPYIAPYLQVAADQLMEDPNIMRVTRDLVAMKREARQNFVASLLSGGRAGGFGRVTEANMRGPNLEHLERLQDERADIINRAIKARSDALGDTAKAMVAGNKLAETLLSSTATAEAAKIAASAVQYKAKSDRVTSLEKDNVALLQGNPDGALGTLRVLYDPAAVETPPIKAARDILGIPKGALQDGSKNAQITRYFSSAATPGQKAAVRLALHESGMDADQLRAIAPMDSQEKMVFATEATEAALYAKAQTERFKIVQELDADLRRSGTGGSTNLGIFASQGKDTTLASNLHKQMMTLSTGDANALQQLQDAVKQPLPAEAKKRLDEIDDEAQRIKAAQGGKLRNDSQAYLRTSRGIRELTKTAVAETYDKKIENLDSSSETYNADKQKLEQQREELIKDVSLRGGRRFETALMSAQRRFQRGQLASEITDEGEIERTKTRDLVADSRDRAQAVGAMARRAETGDPSAPSPQDINQVVQAKDIGDDLGVGRGGAPVTGVAPKASKAAAAPPTAPTETADEEDEDEEKEGQPAAEQTPQASLWRRPVTTAFAPGLTRAEAVRQRVAQLRGDPTA